MALLSDAVWLLNLLIPLNFYANNPDIPSFIRHHTGKPLMSCKQTQKYSPLFPTHVVYFLSDISELELFSMQ